MASMWEMLGRAMGKKDPVAYSRITRTPIYTSNNLPDLEGGEYDSKTDSMTLRPEELQRSPFIIPHESAHSIYNHADLKSVGAKLAGKVGEGPRNRITASPLYRNMVGAGDSEQMSDEGLALSIGDSDERRYVGDAANEIKDPKLRAQLIRLNQNAIATRKRGGIGALQ